MWFSGGGSLRRLFVFSCLPRWVGACTALATKLASVTVRSHKSRRQSPVLHAHVQTPRPRPVETMRPRKRKQQRAWHR